MNDMTGEIWSKFCVLINKMTKKSKRKQKKKKTIQISFNGSNELSGILKYITQKFSHEARFSLFLSIQNTDFLNPQIKF